MVTDIKKTKQMLSVLPELALLFLQTLLLLEDNVNALFLTKH